MKNKDFDYLLPYKIYKMLPLINAGIVFLAGLVCGIWESIDSFTPIGYEIGGASFFIWILIGIVAAAIVLWGTMIFISPTVLRTDAAIKISKAPSTLRLDTEEEQSNQNSVVEPQAVNDKKSITPKQKRIITTIAIVIGIIAVLAIVIWMDMDGYF